MSDKIFLSTPEDADIRYRLDGGVPTEESSLYEGGIAFSMPVKVRARLYKNGKAISDVAEINVIEKLPTPELILGDNTQMPDGSIGTEVILDNISDYPDNALVYYSNTLENPFEGTTYISVSELKTNVKHVVGYVIAGVLALYVAVSCENYISSDVQSIRQLPRPEFRTVSPVTVIDTLVLIMTNVDDYEEYGLSNVTISTESSDGTTLIQTITESEESSTAEHLGIELGENECVAGIEYYSTSTVFTSYVECEGYEDSDVVMTEAVQPKVATPTLSLTRSAISVIGVIGNIVSGATYRYKVGSAPESETDGTGIDLASKRFSFVSYDACTVYVRGFANGYTMSDAVSDSVPEYVDVDPQLSIPYPVITSVTTDGYLYFTITNNAEYDADVTFEITLKSVTGGSICNLSLSWLPSNSYAYMSLDIRDYNWTSGQNPVQLEVYATKPNYEDSAVGTSATYNVDAN